MMLPVSRFKGHQPVGMVTRTAVPWLSISSEPAPHWLWLASWSGAAYQATPPLVFYPPAVWIPEHTRLIQLAEGLMSPDEVGMFQMRDKHLRLTNQIIQRPGGHTPRTCLLLSPSRLSGHVRRDPTKTRETEPEDSSSSSSLHLFSVSPLCQPLHSAPPPTASVLEGVSLRVLPQVFIEDSQDHVCSLSRCLIQWMICSVAEFLLVTQLQGWRLPQVGGTSPTAKQEDVASHTNQSRVQRGVATTDRQPGQHTVFTNTGRDRQQCMFGPVSPSQLGIDMWPILPFRVMKNAHPAFFSSGFSSRFTLLTDYRCQKRGIGGSKISYGGALLLRTNRATEKDKQRPGELTGQDITRIIEDPPHKRKKMAPDSLSHK
ncbi:hypothetical protein PAMA_012059 [Pampus argenteus]